MSDPGGALATPPLLPKPSTGRVLGGAALDVAIGLVVLVVVSLGTGAAWAVWRALQLREEGMTDAVQITAALGEPGALAQMLTAIASMSCAALVLYAWRRRAGRDERRQSLQAMRRGSTWGWTVLTGAGVYLLTTASSWLMHQLGSDPVPTNLSMVEEASQRWPVFLAVFAVVLAPAYEELLFRRVLFGRFLAAGRPWLGLVLSSLAFALMHEVPGISANPWPAMVHLLLVYAGMGAAFAWVYWRTGTFWAAVAAHGLNNGLALFVHAL